MKITFENAKTKEYVKKLFEACQNAAIQLSIRKGIVVIALIKNPLNNCFSSDLHMIDLNPWPIEIVFKTMGKTCDTLKEINKIIKLKAFL